MSSQAIIIGRRLPDAQLGYCDGEAVRSPSAQSVFGKSRAIAIGLPGAFTPVCALQHLPDFIANAANLRKSGFTQLVCITPNDPFVLAAWSKSVDPKGALRFFSDGNLDFAHELGLLHNERSLFMSHRTQRYLLVVDGGLIARVRVERAITSFTCTGAAAALELD